MALLLVFAALVSSAMAGDLLYGGLGDSIFGSGIGLGGPVIGAGSVIGRGYGVPVAAVAPVAVAPVVGKGIGYGPVYGRGVALGVAAAPVYGKAVAAPVFGGYGYGLPVASYAPVAPVAAVGKGVGFGPFYGRGYGVAPVVGKGVGVVGAPLFGDAVAVGAVGAGYVAPGYGYGKY